MLTGAEAFLLLQAAGKDWMEQLAKAKEDLRRLRRVYNLDNDVDAYNRFLRTVGRPPNSNAILAAIYVRSRTAQLAGEHLMLESRAFRIEQQLARLTLTNWNPRDKAIISDFYHGQLAKIQDRLNVILNEMPVVGVTEVKS